jgi:hypothetical protein
MLRSKNGQSIIEYVILLSVVIAALLIMQVFIKRGFQGGLKDSADRMGEQFSAGGTTVSQTRTMNADQFVREEVNTGGDIAGLASNFSISSSGQIQGTRDKDTYSMSSRSGAPITSDTKQKTDSAREEKTRFSDYSAIAETDNSEFAAPFDD